MRTTIILLSFLSLIVSCNNGEHYCNRLQAIKETGDSNPELAIRMLDSIYFHAARHSEHMKNKYDLLRIRLNDKADIAPASDIEIRNLAAYFDIHGSVQEQQEAHYYAGSVYRDLHNTPKGLEHFLKSVDLCKDEVCDSLMLRNAYSNLHWLYYNVQDYDDALVMAQKEYDLSSRLNKMNENAIVHLGVALHNCHEDSAALKYFDEALETTLAQPSRYTKETLVSLLLNYVHINQKERAAVCFINIMSLFDTSDNPRLCMALGEYYNMAGEPDSAKHYYHKTLAKTSDIRYIYDASRYLFRIYKEQGHTDTAAAYADLFM